LKKREEKIESSQATGNADPIPKPQKQSTAFPGSLHYPGKKRKGNIYRGT